jgi:hypothetical protein
MSAPAGDQARVSVFVHVPAREAFRVFTEEIDSWWRRGPKYRIARQRRGFIHIEGGVGGRLFESFESSAGTRVVETGRITVWEPPGHLGFEWRGVNYAPGEKTFVDVLFEERETGTLVTVTHSGWSDIRADHPARHGLEVAAFLRMIGTFWGDLMTSLREQVE